MKFDFAATPKLIFGEGRVGELPQRIKQFGTKALILTGKSSFANSFKAISLFQDFDEQGIEFKLVKIEGEPSPNDVDYSAVRFRGWPDVVVAIGGGSVLDAGKAISAMLMEDEQVINFLEDVGSKTPSGDKVPFIAVPTTAGTGSEASKNAVITVKGVNGFKKSLRHQNYVPDYAIIDPELTLIAPARLTAAAGMDAFTQLLEAYTSTQSNALSDAIAFDGIAILLKHIEAVVKKGDDVKARSAMSYAAYLSGIAIANAGIGVVHGFAQPLGCFYSIPHGMVCGTLMGAANRITVEKLRALKGEVTLLKYAKVARVLFKQGTIDEAIDQLLDFIDGLISQFNMPRLGTYGIALNDIPKIVKHTSLKNHPVALSSHDLAKILAQRL